MNDETQIVVWHAGHGGASDQYPHDEVSHSTWGEFVQANPDIDAGGLNVIWSTISQGQTYRENLGAGGMFGMKLKENRKMRKKSLGEDASACAVGVGSVGATPTQMPKIRTREDQGDEDIEIEPVDDTDEPEHEINITEGQIVEFTRNGVPYRGRVVEVHGSQVVVSTAGRLLNVDKALLETVGKYGSRSPGQTRAMSSPTTPNRTMQKFVGANEALGDAPDMFTMKIDQLVQRLSGSDVRVKHGKNNAGQNVVKFSASSPGGFPSNAVAMIRDTAMAEQWPITKSEDGGILIKRPVPMSPADMDGDVQECSGRSED